MRRRLLLLASFALACPLAAAAAEESGPEPASDASAADERVDWSEWTPALALGITIFSQDTIATTYGSWHTFSGNNLAQDSHVTDCDPGPRNSFCRWIAELGDGNDYIQPRSGTTLRGLTTGTFYYKTDTLDGAAIPVSLELMAPRIPQLPGSPRLFAEVGYRFPREPRFLASRASSGLQTPLPTFPDLPRMELMLKLKSMWWAGVGTAFHAELAGFPFEIRPSLNYFGQSVDFRMFERYQLPSPPNTAIDTAAERSETYHGLGPQIGVNVEMGRRGPFAFNLLLSNYLAWFPGGLRWIQRGIITDPPPGSGGSAPFTPEPLGNETYDFRFDNLQVGGSVAFRVSWIGFAE